MAAKAKKKVAPKKKSQAKKAKSNSSKSKKPVKGKSAKPNASKTKKLLERPRQQAAAGAKPKTKSVAKGESSLVPSRDGVLVERVVESDRTPGGLYIPQSVQEKPVKGIVVGAGRGKVSKRGKLRPLDVQPGDEVLFGKFAGTEIKIDGKEYLLIREDEILGVVS